MKEVYSENPSGRIKGMGKIIFLIFIIGGLIYLKASGEGSIFEEFQYLMEDIGASFESSFDSDYDYDYDYDYDIDYIDPDANRLKEYMTEQSIESVSFTNLISTDVTTSKVFNHGVYSYKLDVDKEKSSVMITDIDNPNNMFIYSNTDYIFDSITISELKYGLLIEIVLHNEDYNVYIFTNDRLEGTLELETDAYNAPTNASDGYVYFGYDDGSGVDVYRYSTHLQSYYVVDYGY